MQTTCHGHWDAQGDWMPVEMPEECPWDSVDDEDEFHHIMSGMPEPEEGPLDEFYGCAGQGVGDAGHLAARYEYGQAAFQERTGQPDGPRRHGGIHLQHGENLQATKTA